ncbi:MAG: hypothetical protein ACKVHT_09140 [Flavobacteriales bacterium]|uniref:Uncharacterized protein n=1 Tax=uncultured Flavobacteriia bacterium TaxID=212695 RepID=H6RDW2_9BACT|nr:hypothetical protein VIS_S3ATA30009 [uncultured Flavobacteriia bacterium]
MIHKAKKSDVNSCKALIDLAYEAIKYSIEVTEGEASIFEQLDLDVR